MFSKVIWKMLDSLTLAADRIDHPIAHPRWNAVVSAHLVVLMMDTNPPVAIRVLIEAAVTIMVVRSLEMSQVFSTHSSVTQNKDGIP